MGPKANDESSNSSQSSNMSQFSGCFDDCEDCCDAVFNFTVSNSSAGVDLAEKPPRALRRLPPFWSTPGPQPSNPHPEGGPCRRPLSVGCACDEWVDWNGPVTGMCETYTCQDGIVTEAPGYMVCSPAGIDIPWETLMPERDGIRCDDWFDLHPVEPAECPLCRWVYDWPRGWLNACHLPPCDQVNPGQLCEGDQECGTDQDLNNCGWWDIYRKNSGYEYCQLRPAPRSEFPDTVDWYFPNCRTISNWVTNSNGNQICEGDGAEPLGYNPDWTDDRLDNFGHFDMYIQDGPCLSFGSFASMAGMS